MTMMFLEGEGLSLGTIILFNFLLWTAENPPGADESAVGRDKSAPTDVRVILLNSIIIARLRPQERELRKYSSEIVMGLEVYTTEL
jgi:hypothetical protein